ncbi:MAG: hypothetical protein V4760_10745 [Bdellovibrionota bacterium]
MEITTPSGLEGEIRHLSIGDGRHLTSLRASKSNKIPDYILSSCWVETSDEGMYKFSNGKPNFGLVIAGDRDYSLMQIRIATFGPEYSFKIQCKAGMCNERFEWSIDLANLPVKHLKKKDRETFAAGNRFEETLPGTNKKIWFMLATGNDLLNAAAQRKQAKHKDRNKRLRAANDDEQNLILESIVMRTLDIEGVSLDEKNPVKKKKLIRAYLESPDLSLGIAPKILDLFDSHDCGVETTIEVECPHCDRKQDVNVPFDEDFFFPRKTSPSVGSTVMMLETKEKEPETDKEEEDEEAGE